MTDPKPEKRGRGWAFYAVVVLGILVLYVASIGPAFAFASRFGGNSERIWRAYLGIYSPIVYLCRGTVAEPAFLWWCELWSRLLS